MNEVLYWNSVLLEASRRDFSTGHANNQRPGPTHTSRAMAIVHLAIHDTVAYYLNPQAAYLSKKSLAAAPPAPAAGLQDAIAGAAVTALTAMYPAYASYFDEAQDTTDQTAFNYGKSVANALLEHRNTDGSAGPATQSPPAGATYAYGAHRPDPFAPGQPVLGQAWGNVRRFMGNSHIPMAAPPVAAARAGSHLTNAHYKQDFEEVRDYGALARNKRSADETAIGLYWGYDGADGLGVPPRLYNQIARKLVLARTGTAALSLAQTADLFARINVAMADAGIDAWHYKYLHNLWRPVVGIRNEAAGDAFWSPLGAPATNMKGVVSRTPPFPAYPSGHATFGAALFQVLRQSLTGNGPMTVADVLATDKAPGANAAKAGEALSFTSEELNGRSIDADGSVRTEQPRSYNNFARAVWENSISRVYLGVHWRFDGLSRQANDKIGGVPLGLDVGNEAHTFFSSGATLATVTTL